MDLSLTVKSTSSQFGDHPRAAGFTMKPEHYDLFWSVSTALPEDYHPSKQEMLSYDAEVCPKDLNWDNWKQEEKAGNFVFTLGTVESEPSFYS